MLRTKYHEHESSEREMKEKNVGNAEDEELTPKKSPCEPDSQAVKNNTVERYSVSCNFAIFRVLSLCGTDLAASDVNLWQYRSDVTGRGSGRWVVDRKHLTSSFIKPAVHNVIKIKVE